MDDLKIDMGLVAIILHPCRTTLHSSGHIDSLTDSYITKQLHLPISGLSSKNQVHKLQDCKLTWENVKEIIREIQVGN